MKKKMLYSLFEGMETTEQTRERTNTRRCISKGSSQGTAKHDTSKCTFFCFSCARSVGHRSAAALPFEVLPVVLSLSLFLVCSVASMTSKSELISFPSGAVVLHFYVRPDNGNLSFLTIGSGPRRHPIRRNCKLEGFSETFQRLWSSRPALVEPAQECKISRENAKGYNK